MSLMLSLYSIHSKFSSRLLLSLFVTHTYSPLNLSRFCFITLVASHSLASSSVHSSHNPRSSTPSIEVVLSTGLVSQSHGRRSRRLVYQAYLQHLNRLRPWLIHRQHPLALLIIHYQQQIQQTGTYLFSRSLVLSLSRSRSFSHSLSLVFFRSLSLTLFLAKYPFSRIIGCIRRRYR